jgi:hypothetical protein
MPEEMKWALMAKAEMAIDELLGKMPAADSITLSDMEELALLTGRSVEEEVLSSLLGRSQAAEQRAGVQSAECGGLMQRKGLRRRRVMSQAGESELERAYYYCEGCGRGLFPLDKQLGLSSNSVYSAQMTRQMVWLSGRFG